MHLQRLISFLALANSIGLGLAECQCPANVDSAAVLRACNAHCDSHFTAVPAQVICQNECSTWLGNHGCSVPHRRSVEYEDISSMDKREAYDDDSIEEYDDSWSIEKRDLTSCLALCKAYLERPGDLCPGKVIPMALYTF